MEESIISNIKLMQEFDTHFRTCNLCEAMCGLEIQYNKNQILSIKGDKKDVLSRGHICPKAVALQDVYKDNDRLKTPIRKTDSGWQKITWEDAFNEIESNIKNIQKKYGYDAVGTYRGNPNVHNLGLLLFGGTFIKSLKTKQKYTATSVDQLPHHISSLKMFGHHMLIPIPDIDRTEFMLIIGGNPVISNGSMMTAPDFANRLKAIQKRGGKFVVIDPRFTETAKIADQYLPVKPGKDALLLLALIHVIFNENLEHVKDTIDYGKGWMEIKTMARDFPPGKVSSILGIPEAQIKNLARDFSLAKSAVCYGRMGVSTQEFGGICQWLINILNIITGNFDREGGAMFTLPLVDLVGMSKDTGKTGSFDRRRSRVRNLPEYSGEYPVATLADEILTKGEGQIKAMFLLAGNPVLSTPNGKKLAKAFKELEFIVALDIYNNESTQFANIILPTTTGLETSHYDLAFHQLAIRNTANYSSPLFTKQKDQKHDWEILRELTKRFTGKENPATPEMMIDLMMKNGPYKEKGIGLNALIENPHGIDLGALRPCMPERLFTEDKKINLAPSLFLKDMVRLKTRFSSWKESKNSMKFSLIGRRNLRSNNSWMHNSHRLVKGKEKCTLLMNYNDAERLNITMQQIVKVTSSTGSIKIPVEINNEMMQGVVSIPHGWGHNYKAIKMEVAQKHAGVSINDLTDENRIDQLTGNADFSGTTVSIESII